MSSLFSKAAMLSCLLFAFSACEKDETQAVLSNGAVPQLTASAATVIATPATANNPVVTYNWTAADFNYKAAVSYTLQFAKQGTNFATTRDIVVGSALTKTLTAGELNKIYNDLDCSLRGSTNPITTLDVRVRASVGDKATPAISSVKTIATAPYEDKTLPAETWAIIGSATPGGWNTETPLTYNFCTRTWSARIALTAAEFKFRANNSWDKNLGDEGSGSATDTGRKLVYNVAPTPNPPNIRQTTAGTFTVTLDVNAKPNPIFTIRP